MILHRSHSFLACVLWLCRFSFWKLELGLEDSSQIRSETYDRFQVGFFPSFTYFKEKIGSFFIMLF